MKMNYESKFIIIVGKSSSVEYPNFRRYNRVDYVLAIEQLLQTCFHIEYKYCFSA